MSSEEKAADFSWSISCGVTIVNNSGVDISTMALYHGTVSVIGGIPTSFNQVGLSQSGNIASGTSVTGTASQEHFTYDVWALLVTFPDAPQTTYYLSTGVLPIKGCDVPADGSLTITIKPLSGSIYPCNMVTVTSSGGDASTADDSALYTASALSGNAEEIAEIIAEILGE